MTDQAKLVEELSDQELRDKIDSQVTALLDLLTSKDEEISQRDFLLAVMAACGMNTQRAMIAEITRYAREAGEATGRLEMSEAAGIVDGWRERAEAAEAKSLSLQGEGDRLRGALEPFAALYSRWAAAYPNDASTFRVEHRYIHAAQAALSQSPLPDASPGEASNLQKMHNAPEVEGLTQPNDLRDIFEREFDFGDPRICVAQCITRSEAEAILEHRGDLIAALASQPGEGVSAAQATSSEVERLTRVLEQCRDETSDLWVIETVDAALAHQGVEKPAHVHEFVADGGPDSGAPDYCKTCGEVRLAQQGEKT